MKKIKRNEFIKLSLYSGAALYFGCSGDGKNNPENLQDTLPKIKDSLITKIKEPTITPTFKLYKKDDESYERLRKGFNKRIEKYPAAIAVCTTTEEVSQAVHYAIENKLPVSIKSGGHSFEGFSCNNDGLVINLSEMNKVTWENEDTIDVEPGCKLSQLYDTVLPKNKILPAGSCGGVGISGLTLGGGYGFFGRKYGLTCDNLTQITMVDGNGNIIQAKNDDELLWACKGGGNGNFGVITSLKFNVKTAPDFFQSTRFKIKINDKEKGIEVLEKWFSVTANLPQHCFSAFVLNGKSLYILLTNYEEKNADIQQAIDQLSAITDKTTLGPKTPVAKALKVFYGRPDPLYFKNSSAGFYKNFDDIKACIPEVIEKVMATSGMIYQVNTLGGMINDSSFAAHSSYAHRDQNYLSELQTYWNSGSQTQRMIDAFEEVQQIFSNNGIKSQYRNYPDINFKNWKEAYYGENYERLKKVKLQYDPQQIFDYEQGVKI